MVSFVHEWDVEDDGRSSPVEQTVFFGANDARLPDTTGPAQSVALEEYEKNLAAIITHPAVKAHNPRVMLITPPPVDERLCEAGDLLKGIDEVRRTAENTASYAAAARRVGEELGVPVLDLWSSFMSAAGWSAGEPLPGSQVVARNVLLNELLHDGLHFNPKGYKILFEEMMKLVAETWPDQVPDMLPFVLPAWDSATAWQDD
ncbi:hypothetical protein B0A49_13346 [Cryomyces minteri]|uniref:Uncharacterized protein n=1 Tax=Cryomyces minteri TaxID=331657 RepID=A0A4U0VWV0_9PEZI|nr:hypothetical protein B0A49_13346 [Cryomyces minteri]